MNRRESVKLLGAAGTTVLGGFGLYRTFSPGHGGPGAASATREWDYSAPEGDGDGARTREGELLLGVTPDSWELEQLGAVESWLGKRHAVVGSFVDLGADGGDVARVIDEHLETKWQRGHVPQVYWQPHVPAEGETSDEIAREIADGEHDDLLHRWADELATWATDRDGPDRRCYLNFAPEMNGDWTPWSPATGDATAEDYAEMWRHVHDIVTDAGLGASHVQWIWALDNTTRRVDREACYPGDEFVDWVGIHGYNWVDWGGWTGPEEVYADTVEVVRSITDRPLAISELGCSADTGDGGSDPERKDRWIADAYEFFREHDVRLTLWFDVAKETDWSVFDADEGAGTVVVDGEEHEVYPAYREALSAPEVLPTHPEHPRRLTDEEFAGEF